jgi:hypothetical protein
MKPNLKPFTPRELKGILGYQDRISRTGVLNRSKLTPVISIGEVKEKDV